MGADGGNYNDDRKVLVTLKKEQKKPSKELLNTIGWSVCQISHEPLKSPIVCDKYGLLYNKEALLGAMLKKNIDKTKFAHIKSMKDVFNANLTPNPNKGDGKDLFICPITKKELTGSFKFYLLKPCGHVINETVFKELGEKDCPVCNKSITPLDKILLNPSPERIEELKKKSVEKRKSEKIDEKDSKKKKVEKDQVETPKNADPEIWKSLFVDPSKNKSTKNDFLNRDGMRGPTNI